MRVKDFSSFDAFGRSFEGTSFGTDLLFAARDAEHGLELWRSDGTDAGTQLLSDINTRDLGGSYPTDLRGVGDTVFFFAYDGTRGGLFKSDGTDAGTSFVIAGAPGRAYPLTLIDSTGVGDKLFVVLSSTEDGSTLWRTDGTASGTLRLTPPGVRALYLHAVGDTVFFVGLDRDHGAELWKTDGTAAGTVLVKDIELGPVIGSNPAHFTTFQGRLYFTAESVFQGRELWVSDGTEAGTVLLKDIGPQLAASPELLTVHAGRLWFFAFDSEHGRELWSTDGTEAGTVLFAELSPGSDYFAPSGMVAAGTRLFFSGEGGSSGSGSLWVTDGTAAPKRIGPVQFRRNPFGESRPVLFDGELFFAGSKSGYNDVLWKTDGTEAGTVPILDRDGQVIPSPRAFQIFGGRVVFTTLGGGLWQTDGTVAGTSGIQDVAGPGESDFRELVPAGPRLFFRGYDRDHGTELLGARTLTAPGRAATQGRPYIFIAGSSSRHPASSWRSSRRCQYPWFLDHRRSGPPSAGLSSRRSAFRRRFPRCRCPWSLHHRSVGLPWADPSSRRRSLSRVNYFGRPTTITLAGGRRVKEPRRRPRCGPGRRADRSRAHEVTCASRSTAPDRATPGALLAFESGSWADRTRE